MPPRKRRAGLAGGLTDGSALPVWEGDLQVWVVFNADEPIASHPTVTTPLAVLVEGYDLSKRIRPTIDLRPKANPLRAIRRNR